MLNKHEILNASTRKGKAVALRGQQHEADGAARERSNTIVGGKFAQQEEEGHVTSNGGRIILHVTCFKYNRKGY